MNDGGQAFPVPSGDGLPGHDGMSLQDYACIKLKIPETGRPWFDDLIRKSLRDDIAAKALQGIITNAATMREITKICQRAGKDDEFYRVLAEISLDYADAMLKAREKVMKATNE